MHSSSVSIIGLSNNLHTWICHYRRNHLLLKKAHMRKTQTLEVVISELTAVPCLEGKMTVAMCTLIAEQTINIDIQLPLSIRSMLRSRHTKVLCHLGQELAKPRNRHWKGRKKSSIMLIANFNRVSIRSRLINEPLNQGRCWQCIQINNSNNSDQILQTMENNHKTVRARKRSNYQSSWRKTRRKMKLNRINTWIKCLQRTKDTQDCNNTWIKKMCAILLIFMPDHNRTKIKRLI